MKKIFQIAFSLGLLLLSGAAVAKCMDLRAVRISPCPSGSHWVPVHGSCTKSYEAEDLFCATDEAPECLDRRVTFYTPCPEGQERFFFQGRCEHSYETEHSYCAASPN
jgi:hypothetical protein